MKSEIIYSKKLQGLDINVWLVSTGCMLLSLGLISFTILNEHNEKDCVPVNMTITSVKTGKDSVYSAGELLSFKANVSGDDNIIWDFGDETGREIGYVGTHKYASVGEYTVKVIVNDKCETEKVVRIIKSFGNESFSSDSESSSGISTAKNITGASSIMVGETREYTFPISANSYLWRVKNEPHYKEQTTPSAKFNFRSKGVYIIELILNNDYSSKITKTVQVSEISRPSDYFDNELDKLNKQNKKAAEEAAKKAKEKEKESNQNSGAVIEKDVVAKEAEKITIPEKPKIKKVGAGNFRLKLEALLKNEIAPLDLYQYLEYKGQTNVLINNRNRISFDEFCKQIAGQSERMRIKDVSFVISDDGTIETIKVSREINKKIGFVSNWKEG